MGVYVTKPAWQRAFQPAVALCVRYRVHPDVFTYGALVLAAVAALALAQAGSNPRWLWLVPASVLLRLTCNLMDGMVARARGLADIWGEVKNELGDRLADAMIFLGLGCAGYADARLAAGVIALVLLVSYLGVLSKAVGGSRLYGGIFGKGDRMISLAVFTIYPLYSGNLASYNCYLGFAILAATLTIVQRLRSMYEYAQSAR